MIHIHNWEQSSETWPEHVRCTTCRVIGQTPRCGSGPIQVIVCKKLECETPATYARYTGSWCSKHGEQVVAQEAEGLYIDP